jgi:hypothetical protein
MKVSIFDVMECHLSKEASVALVAREDALGCAFHANVAQPYLEIKNSCGSTEYILLKPGWAIAVREDA